MQVIKGENIEEMVDTMMHTAILQITDRYMEEVGRNRFNIDDQGIADIFNTKYYGDSLVKVEQLRQLDENEIRDYLFNIATDELKKKKEMFPEGSFDEFERMMVLRVIDMHWTRHIDKMSGLRQGIGLQSYGQQNPLTIYKQQGLEMFNAMTAEINEDILRFLVRTKFRIAIKQKEEKLVTNQGVDDSVKQAPVVNARKELGRNDLCWCGSGRKYKYCHGRE